MQVGTARGSEAHRPPARTRLARSDLRPSAFLDEYRFVQSDAVSYDLHIIRTDNWTTSIEDPILFDEWLGHARSDGSLVEAGVLSLRETEPAEQPVFALANGTSLHWWRGEVVA